MAQDELREAMKTNLVIGFDLANYPMLEQKLIHWHDKALQLAIINALIHELTLQNRGYNLKGGHILMYYRDGKPIYIGERITELTAQKQSIEKGDV